MGFRICTHGRRYAVRGEDDRRPVGDVLDAVGEPVAELLQIADYDFVVDEFMQAPDVPQRQRLRDRRVDLPEEGQLLARGQRADGLLQFLRILGALADKPSFVAMASTTGLPFRRWDFAAIVTAPSVMPLAKRASAS